MGLGSGKEGRRDGGRIWLETLGIYAGYNFIMGVST